MVPGRADLNFRLQGALKSAAKEETKMSVTRRQFLLSTAGAAVGAILPSFYFQALEFLDRFDKPLLEAPASVSNDLSVLEMGECLELNLGDPFAEPPQGLTFREYFTRYDPDAFETFEVDWDMPLTDLDLLVPDDYVECSWEVRDGPTARAYKLLDSLDLGNELGGPDAVGGLEFILGPHPGSNYMGVNAVDQLTLSLLQKRLNDLGTGIRVVTGFAL